MTVLHEFVCYVSITNLVLLDCVSDGSDGDTFIVVHMRRWRHKRDRLGVTSSN